MRSMLITDEDKNGVRLWYPYARSVHGTGFAETNKTFFVTETSKLFSVFRYISFSRLSCDFRG